MILNETTVTIAALLVVLAVVTVATLTATGNLRVTVSLGRRNRPAPRTEQAASVRDIGRAS
jgi:hypothetical protein